MRVTRSPGSAAADLRRARLLHVVARERPQRHPRSGTVLCDHGSMTYCNANVHPQSLLAFFNAGSMLPKMDVKKKTDTCPSNFFYTSLCPILVHKSFLPYVLIHVRVPKKKKNHFFTCIPKRKNSSSAKIRINDQPLVHRQYKRIQSRTTPTHDALHRPLHIWLQTPGLHPKSRDPKSRECVRRT